MLYAIDFMAVKKIFSKCDKYNNCVVKALSFHSVAQCIPGGPLNTLNVTREEMMAC
jgi:hypothetical protein